MSTRAPIAVVGMGCVLPGARTPQQFWRNIVGKVDCTRDVPPGRWVLPAEIAKGQGVEPDRVASLRGCFVDDFELDGTGLSIDPRNLDDIDPAYRIAVEAARQAWLEGQTNDIDRSRAGVIMASIALPTSGASSITQALLGDVLKRRLGNAWGVELARKACSPELLDLEVVGFPAAMVAGALGLRGAAYTLDAACASSLYALKLACDELADGRADAMLAGGLSRPDCLFTQMGFTQLRALSPSGRCAPFDESSDGLLVGEGAGLVLLKRLDDAIGAGDRIYGVIRGFGISNDIGGSLLAPDSEGQLRAMHAAYEQAGWRPDDVDLIECHGTGTPTGDAVEVASLRTLWEGLPGAAGRCPIGSVKSMIGHLLTAAGAAGFIKTLLAMREATLPPSLNFRRSAKAIPLEGSPFRIQTEPQAWGRRASTSPRRAAVSAFGFGGINAHVLVEEFDRGQSSTPAPIFKPQASEVAIVGMDARFGSIQSLRDFESAVFNGDSMPRPMEADRWFDLDDAEASEWTGESVGASIQAVDVPVGKYRLPPSELPALSGQQIVMLESVAAALAHAGMPLRERRPRMGVIVGMSFDMDSTNFSLRWWIEANLRRWLSDFGLNPSEDEYRSLLASAKEAAGPGLDAPRVLGNLGGMIASRIARECQFGGPSFGVSCGAASGIRALEIAARSLQRGELDAVVVGAVDLACDVRRGWAERGRRHADGACAIVLKRLEDARRDGDRVIAAVECNPRPSGGLKSIDLLEMVGVHDVPQAVLADRDVPLTTGSVESTFGWSGAAAGLAGVVKAAACVASHQLPAARNFSTQTNVNLPQEILHWHRTAADGPRRAGVLVAEEIGVPSLVVLSDCGAPSAPPVRIRRPTALFALEASSLDELRARAEKLSHEADADLDQAARKFLAELPLNSQLPLAVAIVAESPDELRRALRQVASSARSGDLAPLEGVPGIYVARQPIGTQGDVAFVYPGAGNHFVGMGRELAVHFPKVTSRLEDDSRRSFDQFMPQWFAPYRGDWSEGWRQEAENQIDADMRRMIFGQVSYCVLASDVIRSLGIEPRATVGYSLGESAALFAMRAWPDRDEMLRRMFSSELFANQLAGPRKAIQASWGIDAKAAATWRVVLVSRSPAEVRDALAGINHARLLIVNTPKECVLGGLSDAVDQVVARLKCRAIPVEGVATVHCDAMQSVANEYREFHVMRTMPPAAVRIYSAAMGASYDLNSETAADAISGHALYGFDFPAVIERAYQDGVRTFIEVGPQASCTRMIRRILGDRPHLAVSASSSTESEWTSILKLAATLIAHRMPVELSSIYSPESDSLAAPVSVEKARCVTVPIGGRLGRPAKAHLNRRLPSAASLPAHTELRESTLVGAGALRSAASATAEAHQAFLHFSEVAGEGLSSALDLQAALVQKLTAIGGRIELPSTPRRTVPVSKPAPQVAFDRALCLEFARGMAANVLGPDFAIIDSYPVRVRLPDEPLMLVDRIMSVEGERRGLSGGRIVTEHDVRKGDWYLDGDRMPICITVESGQADLFLSSYLGIDFVAQGKRAYRLLDATVTFHRGLPRPGETIRYDIRIDRFVRQGETYLFFFEFDGTIAGEPVLTMRQGCAGFFTREEIEKSHGIVLTDDQTTGRPNPGGFSWPLEASDASFDDDRLAALRRGGLLGCFGERFGTLLLDRAPSLPGGRMKLIDRVLTLEPRGGRFGLGRIVAEADIHPDDWFLTCHFVDDMVMPGTLMYECCVHTLRFFLMRMGWVAEADQFCYEPIAGISSSLRCRGPVTPLTKKATYELEIKEAGFRPEPYVLADALMYADGKRIVQMNDMSLQLTGLTRELIDAVWNRSRGPQGVSRAAELERPAFTYEQIHAFAVGNPSDCFGERFRVFDKQRKCARLPGPPYQFLDRITKIDHPQFELAPTSWIEAEYDVPTDAWYFAANRQATMPFAVLLEIALQPCGFLAAYCGSAFTSETDLSFRNLGGRATLHEEVWPNAGTVRTRVRMTDVSRAGGMIIEKFEMQVLRGDRVVYDGDTSFGFFSAAALAQQVGIRDARLFIPDAVAMANATRFAIADLAPLPDRQFRMVDRIDCVLPDGGPHGLGYIAGSIDVDPSAWFFKAHFYQDPVWPGSLGLEAMLQIMKSYSILRWPELAANYRFEAIATGLEHRWSYRGQVIPSNRRVEVQASITSRQESPSPMIIADGFLTVDGVTIYEMKQFGLRMVPDV